MLLHVRCKIFDKIAYKIAKTVFSLEYLLVNWTVSELSMVSFSSSSFLGISKNLVNIEFKKNNYIIFFLILNIY